MAEIARGIQDGTIPEDVRHLDENVLAIDGDLPIYVDGVVVGDVGVGGAHGAKDVRVAEAGLRAVDDLAGE
ncbi:heme-binding protein [Rubrivirga sp. S365]|uniref:Heme-binding protein n=1 Tax=Rubrivirga litoralis TaxID=3075598 RepID=A0ABU3BTE0_9BACT|nr:MULTISPECIES: heme-binding protein [unclassified Rubrivirga]MDT0632565.1 heme-binding protein [Rubrivirga sp. F394]MDT7856747.1 heme-binding protein [Rubrivirga sp. S365]